MVSDCSVSWSTTRAVLIAHVHGEIDRANSGSIFAELAWAADGNMIVVDLTAVSFLDATGLNELIHLNGTLPIRLVAPEATEPRSVLNLGGLLELIPTFETVDEAIPTATV
jgi:anti-anti-sigma factor